MRTPLTRLALVGLVSTCILILPALPVLGDDAQKHRDEVVKVLQNLGTQETAFDSISFGISGAVVVLQGFTVSAALRDEARSEVKKLDWVAHVVQQVELLPVGPQAKQIRKDVLEILEEEVPESFPHGFAKIRIGVDGEGVVTLVGSIRSDDESRYKAALEQVEDVMRVSSVEDKVVKEAR